MSARTIFAALLIAGFSGGSSIAQDSGLVLTIGRLQTNQAGARAVLALENRSSRTFSRIRVECGFYAGSQLVGSGGASFDDIQPGSIAHNDAVDLGASDADNVKCRIVSQR
jgi:hypothetical protein